MMRMLVAGAWCLLVGWIISSSRPARAHADKSSKTASSSEVKWLDQIEGIGRTEEKAKRDAVEQALEKLREVLPLQEAPPVRWGPDLEFVENYLIQYPGKAGDEKEGGVPGESKTLKTWTYQLKPIPLSKVRDLEQQAKLKTDTVLRDERASQFKAWALRLTAAALVSCAVALGVLRRKGRHSLSGMAEKHDPRPKKIPAAR